MGWGLTESFLPFLCTLKVLLHTEVWIGGLCDGRKNHILENSAFTENRGKWCQRAVAEGGCLLNTKAFWRCCLCPGGAAIHGLST